MKEFDRAAAIRLAQSVKDEEIDTSDMPDVAELLTAGKVRLIGRPRKAETKHQITIRLSPRVLDGLRKLGKGWQTRADDILGEWLSRHGLL